MYSLQHPPSSLFYEPKKRLTADEWELIMDALSAYQHNEVYRALYEKLGGAQAHETLPFHHRAAPAT